MTNQAYDVFFEKIAFFDKAKNPFSEGLDKTGPIRKALLWAILNPHKTVAGLAGLGLAAYLAPKLIWAREKQKQNELARVNNTLMADNAYNTYRMAQVMTGADKPKPDTYNYLF